MPMPSRFAQSKPTLNPKLLMTTIALVLFLHIGVGFGLENMPALTVKPTKIAPPLEISFVKPLEPVKPEPIIKLEPAPAPKVEEKMTPKVVPESISKLKPKPTLQSPPKPKPEPKFEPELPKVKPVTQKLEKVIQLMPKPIEPVVQPPIPPKSIPKLVKDELKPVVPNELQIDQQAILAQQAQEAEIIAQQKAQAERDEQVRQATLREQAENERHAEIARQHAEAEKRRLEQQRLQQEQAAQEQLAKEQLAKEQADKERAQREQAEREIAEKQQAEKAAQAKKAAENSEPVKFGNGDAAWRSKPNLNFSGDLARIINENKLNSLDVKLHISSSGSVTSVVITHSSGNSRIDDAVKQRLFSAKLKPFTRNGVAVAGVGNLTLDLN